MRHKSFTFRILIAAVFISASALVGIAQGQNGESGRFNLTAYSGVNFADLDSPAEIPVMQSNLSMTTEHTYTFGSGLQYALTPAWTLEAGYKYSNIRGESVDFETTMHTVSLKNIINLDQIFAPRTVSPVINPFLSAGVGYDFYSYSSPSESFDSKSPSYNLGAGVALRIFKNIDLFSHYEYHFVTNSVDNVSMGLKPDVLTTLTGGIRIHFSSDKRNRRASNFSRRSASVETPPAEPVETQPEEPVEVSPAEYDDFASIARKIAHIEEDVNHLKQRIPATNRLVQRVENMEVLLQEVRSKLNDIPDVPVVENGSGLATSLPRGNYVQIFASDRLSSAQKVRNDAISYLNNRLNDTSDRIFITRRDKFYQVLIGEFSDIGEATTIKNIVTGRHSDAFIIAFPRPMSLQAAYNDIRIVD